MLACIPAYLQDELITGFTAGRYACCGVRGLTMANSSRAQHHADEGGSLSRMLLFPTTSTLAVARGREGFRRGSSAQEVGGGGGDGALSSFYLQLFQRRG
eukprot:746704-Hanusia_phi.AAC.6